MEDTSSISDSCPVTLAVTPRAIPIEGGITKDFVIQMMDASVEKLHASAAAQSEHKIFKVPDLLRMDDKNTKSFDPLVVAIGPYHRGKPHLEPMEDQKRAATRKFICCSGHSTGEFYDKVKDVAGQARTCYDGELGLSDEEFTLMLLFDGCFVLHFIERSVEEKPTELTVSTHVHGFIERDMFLLENQLPPIMLRALMSLKPVKICEFLRKITDLDHKSTCEFTSCPDQLLNLLRKTYLKPPCEQKQGGASTVSETVVWHSFRSVKELREIGIKFKRSQTNHLDDIRFNPCTVWSELTLPHIVVDDLTPSRLLNMIALEMHLGSEGDHRITSYVWFLDCLIDHRDDVRELRDAGILLNALGSDKQVATLFNELAADLPDCSRVYDKVVAGVIKHRSNKVRVSFCKFLHTHFSCPWTAIAFVAAVFLLALSVIQTIFTVFPRS